MAERLRGNHTTERESVEALELAIEAEKQSVERYLEYAWQTEDYGGKNMFVRLATDEMTHLRLLERQKESLRSQGCWQPFEIPATMLERVVPKLRDKDTRIQGKKGLNQLTGLQTALDLEIRARDFYREQAQAAGPAEARSTLGRLAEMEQAHVDLLQAEIDSIENTGFWFATREFTLESER